LIPRFPTNSTSISTPALTLTHTRPFDHAQALKEAIQRTLIGLLRRESGEGIVGSCADAHYEMEDAMQLSKRLSNGSVSLAPQRRKEKSGIVLSLNREGIQASVRASVRAEPGVIEMLEELLDESRGGEATAGAIVLVRPNGTICTAISAPHGGRHQLVAACDYLKQDIIAETDN
jgi:hypothetical protein